eukprot:Tamp_18814.p1 GENE.Tamp_18814~~Tamp_18814.p1  ORF type:complete len:426 (+),score=44.18 Tamp_18814:158-1279(+)
MSAKRSVFPRADLLRQLAVPLAGAAAFRTGAAIAVIGQPRMPPVTGPFGTVGVRIIRVQGAGGDSCRAKVFYPAQDRSEEEDREPQAVADAPYCTEGRETSDGMAGLVGFRQLGLSFLLAHLADAKSGCRLGAPPDAKGTLPLLVYSHGYGGNMDMATYFMREIASHGAVVVALEHADGTASSTRRSDGSLLPFSPRLLSSDAQLLCRARELLAGTSPTNLPADLPIDYDRVFLGGHSYGGPACLTAAALQASGEIPGPQIRGLLLHDPALAMGQNLRLTRDCPTVSFTSDEYDRGGVICGRTQHAKGCFHGNFVDAALWAPPWVMRPLSAVIPAAGPCDPARMHSVLARAAAAFMSDPKGALMEDPLLELRE